MQETYIKVAGQWKYLHSAVDKAGDTVDFLLTAKRDKAAARRYLERVINLDSLMGSMSRKSNCWDNTVMKRFFLNLKMKRVWQKDYANHAKASNDAADYVVSFYNTKRLHSKLGNMSPNAFERESTHKKPIQLSEIT